MLLSEVVRRTCHSGRRERRCHRFPTISTLSPLDCITDIVTQDSVHANLQFRVFYPLSSITSDPDRRPAPVVRRMQNAGLSAIPDVFTKAVPQRSGPTYSLI